MDPNIERLLGGYATGSLTDAERAALFQASLDDQEVFNALQDEEALRDLLADAESKRAIQQALRPRRNWLLWTGALAAAALALVAILPRISPPPPVATAVLNTPTIPAAPYSVAPPPVAPPAAKTASRPKIGPAPKPEPPPPTPAVLAEKADQATPQTESPAFARSMRSSFAAPRTPLAITVIRGEAPQENTVRFRVEVDQPAPLVLLEVNSGQVLFNQIVEPGTQTFPQTPLAVDNPRTYRITLGDRTAQVTVSPVSK